MQLLFLCVIFLIYSIKSEDTTQPNIIFIFADDLGWNDVGYHKSSEIKTDYIDSLADNGLLLESHYVQPQCTPTRAAFLTGRHPIRYGLHHDSISPTDTFGLSLTEILLPEELKNLGYTTHLVGKWHLGYYAWEYTPTYRGFDTFFGFYNGAEHYFDHDRTWNGMTGSDFRNGTTPVNLTGQYSTDLIRDETLNRIKYRDSTKPFFIYLSFQAVHSPNQYDSTDSVWKSYKTISDHSRRVHAYKTTKMDDAIGDVINLLKSENLWDNTLIIFSSDNGAVYNAGSNYPLRGSKATIWEGGIRSPTIVSGGYLSESRRGLTSNELMHVADWYPTLLSAIGTEPYAENLDGINQWNMIQYGETTSREWMLIEIDPLDCELICGSIRYGKYKLIRDPRKTLINERYKTGCYWTDDFKLNNSSPTLGCSSNDRPSYSIDDECPCGTSNCLFNIEEDPCEYNDLSSLYPDIVELMYETLGKYNASVVTPLSEFYLPDDAGANPIRQEGFWGPWQTPEHILLEDFTPPTTNEWYIKRWSSLNNNSTINIYVAIFGGLGIVLLTVMIIIYYYHNKFSKNNNKNNNNNKITNKNINNNKITIHNSKEFTPLLS